MIVDDEINLQQRWTKLSSSDDGSIAKLLKYAQKSKTARLVIKKSKRKASRYGQTLLDVIEAGKGSLTDTTLIRKFSPSSPLDVFYETRSKVILNKDLNVFDAILDLIHELVHYTYRTPFNPYTTDFSLDEFVKSTIAGKGGEVDAYLTECKVLKELFPSKIASNSNCLLVSDPISGQFKKKRGVEQFFRVGKYYSKLKKGLGTLSNELSNKEAFFISSAYGMPYPLAAVYEFNGIMGKACKNDKKRLDIMKAQAQSRRPASQRLYAVNSKAVNFERSLMTRCQNFL